VKLISEILICLSFPPYTSPLLILKKEYFIFVLNFPTLIVQLALMSNITDKRTLYHGTLSFLNMHFR